MIKHFKFLTVLFLFINTGLVNAQDTLQIDKKLYYRVTIGAGIGYGYPLQEKHDFGIGANIEFALQKQMAVYGLGARGLQEFQIFAYANVTNSVSSIDMTYGRIFKKGAFFTSVSGGIGLVIGVQQGKLLSSGGGGFHSYSYYEKLVYHTIGFPLSAKIFWMPRKNNGLIKNLSGGLGIELFVNINSQKTFYGINLCTQLRFKSPKNKKQKTFK